MWKWEHESMDQDMANQMQLNQSDEWQAMIDEFAPHVTNAHRPCLGSSSRSQLV